MCISVPDDRKEFFYLEAPLLQQYFDDPALAPHWYTLN